MVPPSPPSIWVLIPVKAFGAAKGRLAAALSPAQREALARELATRVVRAAAPLPVAIVCDDPSVSAWAANLGAEVLWRPGHGLNAAVTDGVDALAARGVERVVVAHADLPSARTLAWVARFVGVTIVPDRHDDGTNVLSIPTQVGFTFAYGAGSFRRHAAEARRLGLGLRVVRDPALGWDVDTPHDLAEFAQNDQSNALAPGAASSVEAR